MSKNPKKASGILREKEDWEKEFDKIAPADLEIDDWVVNLRPVILPIKDFIKTQIQKAYKKGYKDGWSDLFHGEKKPF